VPRVVKTFFEEGGKSKKIGVKTGRKKRRSMAAKKENSLPNAWWFSSKGTKNPEGILVAA